MRSKNNGRPASYDESFKIAVAREYLSSHLSFKQLASKYGIARADTVQYFVKWYKSRYPQTEAASPTAEAPAHQPEASGELEVLRKQLKEAQLKVAGYEIMMSIAQKELGIDIPKKFGTKQSDK